MQCAVLNPQNRVREHRLKLRAKRTALSWMVLLALQTGVALCSAAGDSAAAFEDANSRSVASPSGSPVSPVVLSQIFDEAVLADNVRQVMDRCAQLDRETRYQYLLSWVLPSGFHSDIRLSGQFAQTDPPPLLTSVGRQSASLISPNYELLDVAADLGRLEQLRGQVTALPDGPTEHQQRAKAALLGLICLELNDAPAVEAAFTDLRNLVAADRPMGIHDQWPEMLAAFRGLHRFPHSRDVQSLIDVMYAQRTGRGVPADREAWHTQLASLFRRSQYIQRGNNPECFDNGLDSDDWIAAARTRSWLRGRGAASARWIRTADDEIHHVSGHYSDAVYFRLPLQGSFEIHGDIGAAGSTQFLFGGRGMGSGDGGRIMKGTFRRNFRFEPIDPPVVGMGQWTQFRAVFDDQNVQLFLDGRLVQEERLPDNHDPWIAFRGWWNSDARFRNVQITGRPVIPEAVSMSEVAHAESWLIYHDTGWWRFVEDDGDGQMIGDRWGDRTDCHSEGVMHYHRPLQSGDSVEYEFLYRPDQVNTHPVLDRLVFLMEAEGIRIHWITDAEHDRTALSPNNAVVEPENRRGPKNLPLKPGEWNRVVLRNDRDVVTLELNGVEVYSRRIETGTLRRFGFYRDVGNETSRVRNVNMRGHWPRQLPSVDDQELADTPVPSLDARTRDLPAVYVHDFAADGIPKDFGVYNTSGGRVAATSEGAILQRPGTGGWSAAHLVLPFFAKGDFDIEAEFTDARLEGTIYAAVLLEVHLNDEKKLWPRLLRHATGPGRQTLQVSQPQLRPDGSRTYGNRRQLQCLSVSGRMRIARRGSTLHYLFAEQDSEVFRLVSTETASDRPIDAEGIMLRVMCEGTGQGSVVWKSIRVAAEELFKLSEPQRMLVVMNGDGTDLHQVTGPIEGFTHLGSAEWSADGQKLICDMSRGGTDTSHIIRMDADGTNIEDLGPGCMPSLSPDGKQLVFSQPGYGIMRMNADGTERTQLDRSGWGTQWSPDGKQIVWGSGNNMTVLNTETDERRLLLTEEQSSGISYIYWNPGWSHDSRSVAFKARLRGANDESVIVADLDSPDGFKVLYTAGGINADFTWSPDDQQVLFATHDVTAGAPRLHAVHRHSGEAPVLLPGQPADWKIFDCDQSHDGRRIAFSALLPPEPIRWSGQADE